MPLLKKKKQCLDKFLIYYLSILSNNITVHYALFVPHAKTGSIQSNTILCQSVANHAVNDLAEWYLMRNLTVKSNFQSDYNISSP